jgi:hypothetical protein
MARIGRGQPVRNWWVSRPGAVPTFEITATPNDGYSDTFVGSLLTTLCYTGVETDRTLTGFFRMLVVAIPQGATITSATLTLNVLARFGSPAFNVAATAEDNAAAVSGVAELAARTRTTATAWTPAVIGSHAIDVTAAVQAVVNRAGWTSGNAMLFVTDSTVAQGTLAEVQVNDYSQSPTLAARLSVVVGVGGGTPATAIPSTIATAASLASQLPWQPPFVFKAEQPVEQLAVAPAVPLRATVVTADGPITAPFIGQIGYSPDSGIQAGQGLSVRPTVVKATELPVQRPYVNAVRTSAGTVVTTGISTRSIVVATQEPPPPVWQVIHWPAVTQGLPARPTVVNAGPLPVAKSFVYIGRVPATPVVLPAVPIRTTIVTADGPITAPFVGQIGYSPDSGIQAEQGPSPVRPTVVKAQEPPPPVWQVALWPVVTQGLPIRPTFVDAGPLPIAKSFVYVGKVPTSFVAPPATPMRSTVVAAQPLPQPTQQPQVRRVPPEAARPTRSIVVGAQPVPPQQGQARVVSGFAEAPAPNEVPVPIRPIVVRAQPLPPEHGLANISSGFAEALTPAVPTKPIVIGAQSYPPRVQAPLVAWTAFSEKVVTKPLIVRQQPIPPPVQAPLIAWTPFSEKVVTEPLIVQQQPIPPQAPFIFTPRGGRWGDPVPRVVHPHVNVDMSLPFRPYGWSRVAHGFAEALPQTFEGTITGGIKAGAVTGGIAGTGAGLMGSVQSNGYVTGGTR